MFEVLCKELTSSVLEENKQKEKIIIQIIKESFNAKTMLGKELSYYRALKETEEMEEKVAEKVVQKTIETHHNSIDSAKLFQEQSSLIKKINRSLSSSAYSQFIPNYQYLATLCQIFSKKNNPKKRVMLEQTVISHLSSTKNSGIKEMVPVDNLVLKKFVSKFNSVYGDSLLREQKELIGKYIELSALNEVDFKIYLNEEVGRLKEGVRFCLETKEVKEDKEMSQKTKEVAKLLEEIKNQPIDEQILIKVMRVQQLVNEAQVEEQDGN